MENPFFSLIGHENVKKFLLKSFENGRLAHAYIFCGPENVGKTRTAEIFAAALLGQPPLPPKADPPLAETPPIPTLRSEQGENEPPYSPPVSLREIGGARGGEEFQNLKNNPDFTLIEREINEKTQKLSQNITINQIRGLRERIQSTSLLGGRKVVVVKEASLMTLEASNALLKNLEEPRGDTVIILLVSDPKQLPETITSRCQIIYFHPVPLAVIKEYLIKFGADPKNAELIAPLSGSRPGLALRLFKDKNLLVFYKKQTELFLEFFDLSLSERLSRVKKMAVDAEKEKLYTILGIWMIAARGLMHKSFNIDAIERIHLATVQIKANVNPKLILESLVINL